MKLVLISDTHNRVTRTDHLPAGDVLIHAGDLTMDGGEVETMRGLDWLVKAGSKFPRILLIAGNHDFYFEAQYKNTTETELKAGLALHGITYLRDSSVTIDGVKFYGSPWQPEFGGWAFNLPRQGGILSNVWSRIPLDTDVLITHGPPKGILDVSGPRYGSVSVGDELLREVVDRIKPDLHVFGHIHGGYGMVGSLESDDRLSVNASQVDEDYAPTNAPIVVEI